MVGCNSAVLSHYQGAAGFKCGMQGFFMFPMLDER